MIIPVTISKGGSAFGYIVASFPAGAASCTCANGGTVLQADAAGLARGQFVFEVPAAGTWTVTISNGTDTKSESVSITAAGQAEAAELSFSLYILKDGALADGYTFVNRSGEAGVNALAVLKDGIIQANKAASNNIPWRLEPATSFEQYNTLHFHVNNITHDTRYPKKFGASSKKYQLGMYNATYPDIYTKLTGATTDYTDVSVDITNCNDSYYIGMEGPGEFYCDMIRLE
nr:MAG TPA: hypothetical protein [Caudoviricetes sp.]